MFSTSRGIRTRDSGSSGTLHPWREVGTPREPTASLTVPPSMFSTFRGIQTRDSGSSGILHPWREGGTSLKCREPYSFTDSTTFYDFYSQRDPDQGFREQWYSALERNGNTMEMFKNPQLNIISPFMFSTLEGSGPGIQGAVVLCTPGEKWEYY
jgi:hypothetical protein